MGFCFLMLFLTRDSGLTRAHEIENGLTGAHEAERGYYWSPRTETG